MKRILIVDDDSAVTNYLMVFLVQTGRFEPVVLNESGEVPELLEREDFDLLLLDMDMPQLSGMDILKAMRERSITLPVIVLTGVSDVELAVKAMKLGAFDYLTKPVDEEHLLEVMGAAMEHGELHQSIEDLPERPLREDLDHAEAFRRLRTEDPGVIRVLHQAEKMAASDLPILIWGERGTGKESLARAIHEASQRREGPFVAMDASAQDPEHFAADFFGQARDWSGRREERQGFLEQADGGTLFFDGLSHLAKPMQVRLKRAIQAGEFYRESSTEVRGIDVRFIVSSNVDLNAGEYQDLFSRDLLYHLMVNSLHLPALRERMGDLSLLADRFLRRELKRTGRGPLRLAPELLMQLQRYDFPDNLRELRTIVAAAVVSAEGDEIGLEELSPYVRSRIEEGGAPAGWEDFRPRSLAQVELEHARKMLEYYGGARERCAGELGISVPRLDEILGGEGE